MLLPAGEIKNMTVPWLLQELRRAKKSGTAIFERDGVSKKVYFRNGDILFAASNIDGDRLGEFLLAQGRITRAQFEASSEVVKKTNKKLGAVLCELGFLPPKDLVVQVKLQIRHIVLSLFQLQGGRYRFEEGVFNDDKIIPLQMSTANLILEAIQAMDWEFVRKALPPIHSILCLSADPSLIFQKADLTEDQKSVFELIDGTKTIEQICSLSGIGDFNALKAVYLLLALKMAETGESGGKQKSSMREAAPEATAESGRASRDEPKVTKQLIQEAFDAMQTQDDYQVLSANAATSAQELRKTYLKLAKRFHPDRHFEPDMAEMKQRLEALFSRIHEAYHRISESDRHPGPVSPPQPTPDQQEEKPAEDNGENGAEKTARARSYFNAGIEDFKIGNFWGAADAFAWAVRLDPEKAQYFCYYGISLSHIPRRRREGEENLQKAIELDPRNPEYRIELGNQYLRSGLRAKALDAYAAGLRDMPESKKLLQAMKTAGGDVLSEK